MKDATVPAVTSPIDHSIAAFEAAHQVTVTLHDLDGSLGASVDPLRSRHRHRLCDTIKAGSQAGRCYRFEVNDLRPRLDRLTEGRIHRCHAGLVEWVMPIRAGNDHIHGVLFAGPRRWVGPCSQLVDEQIRAVAGCELLPSIDAEGAHTLLEMLAQLAARLCQHVEQQALPCSSRPAPKGRREHLQEVLRHHAHEAVGLDRLARRWGVSTSRATHLVRELTGCSWRQLLMNRRLQLAGHLLRTTDLALDAVAQRSGFGERVALGRAFRQHHGTSPGRWRRQQDS